MKQYSFLLEKHNMWKSRFVKDNLSGAAISTGLHGLGGSLLGFGIGEITGRIASRNETDPEKKKRIRNKHRLIGTGLGLVGGTGIGAYREANWLKDHYKQQAKDAMEYGKSLMKRQLDAKLDIQKNRDEIEQLDKKYTELKDRMAQTSDKSKRLNIELELINVEHAIRSNESHIRYLENYIRSLKKNMSDERKYVKEWF